MKNVPNSWRRYVLNGVFIFSLLPMVLGSPGLKEDTALAVIVCSFLNSD